MITTAITTSFSTPREAPNESSERIELLDLKAAHRALREPLENAWRRVRDSASFIGGDELRRFEGDFARYCGVRHGVGVGNGLDALRLILEGYGIGPGDEVIVPAHTFIATWLSVTAVGATPVPVDVDARTMNIDPDRVERSITRRTRAIIAVHLYGQPAPMDGLRTLADHYGLFLFEDAAQAHGARWRGRRVGGLGDAAAFSFYPGKNLGALGDGGMVVSNDAELAESIRKLRNYGAGEKYHHDCIGGNSRLDELQAAFLNEKLRVLDGWNGRRRVCAAIYDEALRDIPGLLLPVVGSGALPVWHQYVIRVERRDALADWLEQNGIGHGIHYPVPPHRSPAYRDHYRGFELPVSEALAASVLSLPMGPHLGIEQQQRVIDAVLGYIAHV